MHIYILASLNRRTHSNTADRKTEIIQEKKTNQYANNS